MTIYPMDIFSGKKNHLCFFEGLNTNSSFLSTLRLVMLLVRLMCFKSVGWYLSCQKGRLKTHLSSGGFILQNAEEEKENLSCVLLAYIWGLLCLTFWLCFGVRKEFLLLSALDIHARTDSRSWNGYYFVRSRMYRNEGSWVWFVSQAQTGRVTQDRNNFSLLPSGEWNYCICLLM